LPAHPWQPLPNNDTQLLKQPLWDYLEGACYVRPWSPGKTFIAFNITPSTVHQHHHQQHTASTETPLVFGTYDRVAKDRLRHISLGLQRQLIPYDAAFHAHRAVFFPGHDKNRLLTLWYGFFFFADPAVERWAKRFMRDRVRYLDIIPCAAGKIIDHLRSDVHKHAGTAAPSPGEPSFPLVTYGLTRPAQGRARVYRLLSPRHGAYIAYHIRRGDFQQKHTRLAAEVHTLACHTPPSPSISHISNDDSELTPSCLHHDRTSWR